MTVSCLRVLLHMPASKQWRKFDPNDYKWNIRTFKRYGVNDLTIMAASPLFNKLPEVATTTASTPPPSRKRKTGFTPTTGDEFEPPKTVFIVSLVTSSESDTGEDDDDVCDSNEED